MTTLTFDTYDFISRLKSSGIEETQAVAIAEGLRKIDLQHVATKDDISLLRQEILSIKLDTLRWMVPILLGQAAVIVSLIKLL